MIPIPSSPRKRRNQNSSSKGTKMASANKKRENNERVMQISPAIDEWRVEYARFVNRQPSAFTSTHPLLTPVPKHRTRSSWISTADAGAASVQLIYEKTSSGTDDAVLVLSLRSKTLVSLKISSLCSNFSNIYSVV